MASLDAAPIQPIRCHWEVPAQGRLVNYHKLREPHNVLHSTSNKLLQQTLTNGVNSLTISQFNDWEQPSAAGSSWVLKMGKSNTLDACPNPHNALGNLCSADACLAYLPEPFPLIPFTVWRISAISAQKLISVTKNMPVPQANAFETESVCYLLHPHGHLGLFLGVMFSVVYSALGAV